MRLLSEKAHCLPIPDALVCSLGTRIYWPSQRGDGSGWDEDVAWSRHVAQGWSRDAARDACDALVMSVRIRGRLERPGLFWQQRCSRSMLTSHQQLQRVRHPAYSSLCPPALLHSGVRNNTSSKSSQLMIARSPASWLLAGYRQQRTSWRKSSVHEALRRW